MSEDRKNAMIEKISKILLKAESVKGTPEGDIFFRKAALLMAEHRIEEAELNMNTDSLTENTVAFYKDGPDYPQWLKNLVFCFCNAFSCERFFNITRDEDGEEMKEYTIVGSFADVETTIYFIEVVSNHIEGAGWDEFPNERNWRKRNQMGNVAVQVIESRMQELMAARDATIHEKEGCMDLVIRKDKEIKLAVATKYPDLHSVRSSRKDMPTDGRTIAAGKAAGKSAPMNFAVTD